MTCKFFYHKLLGRPVGGWGAKTIEYLQKDGKCHMCWYRESYGDGGFYKCRLLGKDITPARW